MQNVFFFFLGGGGGQTKCIVGKFENREWIMTYPLDTEVIKPLNKMGRV